MTDGATFTIRELRKENKYWGKDLEEAWNNLISDDPNKAWTSG
jgi:hypothetical protein